MKEKIFFRVFICTVTLTILSLTVAVMLLLIDTPNPQETKSLRACLVIRDRSEIS